MPVTGDELRALAQGRNVWDAVSDAMDLTTEEEDEFEDWLLDSVAEFTPPHELSPDRLAELLNQYENGTT